MDDHEDDDDRGVGERVNDVVWALDAKTVIRLGELHGVQRTLMWPRSSLALQRHDSDHERNVFML